MVIEHERRLKDNLSSVNHAMFLWQLANLELWQESLQTQKEDFNV